MAFVSEWARSVVNEERTTEQRRRRVTLNNSTASIWLPIHSPHFYRPPRAHSVSSLLPITAFSPHHLE